MDTSKLSRFDWVVVGGMILMFISLFLAWYKIEILQDIVRFSMGGWHFGAAVTAWLLTLLAAALVIVKGIPSLKFSFPLPEGITVMALGGVAFLLVLYRLIALPVQGLGRGGGIYVALLATAVVAFGGFLKNAETP
jgi:hypothetical protein